jgi:hypothetical protein
MTIALTIGVVLAARLHVALYGAYDDETLERFPWCKFCGAAI